MSVTKLDICKFRGHELDVMVLADNDPAAVQCSRCGRIWKVTEEDEEWE